MPNHGYYTTMAGKRSFAHFMAIWDVLNGKDEKITHQLHREITQAIQERRFQAILLNDYEGWISPEISDEINKYYHNQGRIFNEYDVFRPVAGMKTRPEFIFIPRNTAE